MNSTVSSDGLLNHLRTVPLVCESFNKINIISYYMALSHKDWELPNPRIWLAETDIDRGLDLDSFCCVCF